MALARTHGNDYPEGGNMTKKQKSSRKIMATRLGRAKKTSPAKYPAGTRDQINREFAAKRLAK